VIRIGTRTRRLGSARTASRERGLRAAGTQLCSAPRAEALHRLRAPGGSPYTLVIDFAHEAVYHLLVAAPVPGILVVLAFVKVRGQATVVLLISSLLLFVLIYLVSYVFFCVGCT
jgi:hypothetical protein